MTRLSHTEPATVTWLEGVRLRFVGVSIVLDDFVVAVVVVVVAVTVVVVAVAAATLRGAFVYCADATEEAAVAAPPRKVKLLLL